MTRTHILALSCVDRPGVVAAVSSLLADVGANIVESQQYGDPDHRRFFMRVGFESEPAATADFSRRFTAIADRFAMEWRVRRQDSRQKVLILVSKFDHCLADLLYRQRTGELPIDVVGVASNHARDDIGPARDPALPFHHLPIVGGEKRAQEAQLLRLVEDSGAELVVLARYMQVLSDEAVAALAGHCINIHHSFLPGFKGARPYHQAHARGVKMIGATAHYVTADLDEGPIIHQDVEAISHADTVDDLVDKGRDIERRVLARAVRYHVADRVFLNGERTVVFRD